MAALAMAGFRSSSWLKNTLLSRFAVAYCSRNQGNDKFDTSLLDILVCPLSKEPLRYDEVRNELICDRLKVAYPVVSGLPNLIPTDGRIVKDAGAK